MQAQAVTDKGKDERCPKYIPIDTVINLADAGNNLSEIAKIVNCSPQNISARLLAVDYNGLKTLREKKDKVFERLQWELAKSIEPADIKNMAVRDRIMGIGILEDKIRILRGQSIGQDIQINVIQALGDRTKDLRSILDKLSSTQDVVDVEHKAIDNSIVPSIEHTQCNDNSNLGEGPSLHNASYTTGDSVTHKEAEAKPRRRGRPAKGR